MPDRLREDGGTGLIMIGSMRKAGGGEERRLIEPGKAGEKSWKALGTANYRHMAPWGFASGVVSAC